MMIDSSIYPSTNQSCVYTLFYITVPIAGLDMVQRLKLTHTTGGHGQLVRIPSGQRDGCLVDPTMSSSTIMKLQEESQLQSLTPGLEPHLMLGEARRTLSTGMLRWVGLLGTLRTKSHQILAAVVAIVLPWQDLKVISKFR